MASSTNKRVLMVRFDREPLLGVINPSNFLQQGEVELLNGTGNLVLVPVEEIKAIAFIRENATNETWRKHRIFTVRPKMEGLWLRISFRDLDTLDGVVANNLLGLDADGFTVTPPDPQFLNQRIFVPRSAAGRVQVMGVIGTPLRKAQKPKKKPAPPVVHGEQIEMFGPES
jgi:hypothetical protein